MGTLADVPELPKHLVKPYRHAFRRGLILGLACGLPIALLYCLCQFFLVGPVPVPPGTDYFMGTGLMFSVLSILAMFFAVLMGVFFLPFKAVQLTGIQLVLSGVTAFGLLYLSMNVSDWMRARAFTALTERAQPLVNAIHAFEKDNGHPPPMLSALVPEYLSKVPGTGIGSCPDFYYNAKGLEFLPTGSWYLGFDTTDSGLLDFDSFFYEPAGRYDGATGSNYYERFGDWVYMHD